MSDWQERITRETAPSIRAEHSLRYRTAAPLIAASAAWADLGCGTGLAAHAALGEHPPRRVVLIDADADAAAQAAAEIGAPETVALTGDLTDPGVLAQVEQALLAEDGDRVVTCFEVVEHLATFVPLLEWSTRLARDGAATFILSVPNDAFWAIENPYHAGSWGEGAFRELTALLPPARTLHHQVALGGSAITGGKGVRERHSTEIEIAGNDAVPTHFLAAYGPRHAELSGGVLVEQTDLDGQRQWERQRESNLAFAEALLEERNATVREQQERLDELNATVKEQVAQFDAWRAYIHELEQALGRPLSGGDAAPPPAPTPPAGA